jgi:hypothetical protein
MDLFALGLGKAVCQASTAIVYAAQCSDASTLRSLGYSFFVAVAPCDRPQREAAPNAALECAGVASLRIMSAELQWARGRRKRRNGYG